MNNDGFLFFKNERERGMPQKERLEDNRKNVLRKIDCSTF